MIVSPSQRNDPTVYTDHVLPNCSTRPRHSKARSVTIPLTISFTYLCASGIRPRCQCKQLLLGARNSVLICVLDLCRACKEVVVHLLEKSESNRLGSMTGASEVKAHKWFSKINWGLLRNTKPPVSMTFLSSREARVLRFRGRRHRHNGGGVIPSWDVAGRSLSQYHYWWAWEYEQDGRSRDHPAESCTPDRRSTDPLIAVSCCLDLIALLLCYLLTGPSPLPRCWPVWQLYLSVILTACNLVDGVIATNLALCLCESRLRYHSDPTP